MTLRLVFFIISLLLIPTICQCQVPGLFIENKGQWPGSVAFRTQLPGGAMYLTDKGITYGFYSQEKVATFHSHITPPEPALRSASSLPDPDRVPMHSFDMTFEGAKLSEYNGEDGHKANFNFYKGNDPTHWGKGAKGYKRVALSEIYPGIGARFYSVGTGEIPQDLKYDLLIAPGADPNIIKMKYRGASSVKLAGGQLIIETSVNRMVESRPIAYQVAGTDTLFIRCRFTISDNQVGFSFPSGYNPDLPMVIDPILIFSTFSGSNADNWGFTATYDDNSNFYSGGIVFDPGFPSTIGAYDISFNGGIDIGILKYDSLGSSLDYATYLGASNTETPHSLIVDNAGNLVILGATGSPDFPTTAGAYKNTFEGGPNLEVIDGITFDQGADMYIAKLSNDGSELLGSTLLGGQGLDCLMSSFNPLSKNYGDEFRGEIYIDENDFIYAATSTESADFFGSYTPMKAHAGAYDGVIVKMSPDLSNLEWGTFFGGSNHDGAYAIRTDANGYIYAAGGTSSSDIPLSSMDSLYGGSIDGWIARFDPATNTQLGGTYLGTSAYDQAYLLDQDADDNIFILGQTKGNYPIQGTTYRNSNAGQFLHKLTPALDSTLFSTTLGQINASGAVNPDIRPTAFLVNDCDIIFISGWGGPGINNRVSNYVLNGREIDQLPLTSDAFQSTTDNNDFYLMVLGPQANRLLYATYFGGKEQNDHVDGGTSRFDKRGIVYQSVCAGCGGTNNFPTTAGAWSRINSSFNCNNAAFKFDLATLDARFEAEPQTGCAPLTVNFINLSVGGKNFIWDFGNGETFNGKNPPPVTYPNAGQYTVSLLINDEQTCAITSRAQKVISVFEGQFFMPADVNICQGDQTVLQAGGADIYSWMPEEGLSDPTIASPTASPDSTTMYVLTAVDANGCTFTDSVMVSVTPQPDTGFEMKRTAMCEGIMAVDFSFDGEIYEELNWNFGDGTTSADSASLQHEYDEPGAYTVTLTTRNGICEQTFTRKINVERFRVGNVITPDAKDGKNDTFTIISPEPVDVVISNRWGKVMHEAKNYGNDWNGADLAAGVYYFEILLPNGESCTGWLQLLK
ncbi:PKD domain-containing protein [Roseivirga sp. BDSF3-8]|uniref:DUF7948 domain-containing protein n=1 Tax=Roseivirga sp. BDSF3-8 TaxID=3241598 RepID=UPI0035323144